MSGDTQPLCFPRLPPNNLFWDFYHTITNTFFLLLHFSLFVYNCLVFYMSRHSWTIIELELKYMTKQSFHRWRMFLYCTHISKMFLINVQIGIKHSHIRSIYKKILTWLKLGHHPLQISETLHPTLFSTSKILPWKSFSHSISSTIFNAYSMSSVVSIWWAWVSPLRRGRSSRWPNPVIRPCEG